VISAQRSDSLQEAAANLSHYLQRHQIELCALAATLQIGRDPMPERFAMVAASLEEAQKGLCAFAAGQTVAEGFRDSVSEHGANASQEAQRALQAGRWHEAARLWAAGARLDWLVLYQTGKPRTITLPTYPFARESYPVGELAIAPPPPKVESAASPSPEKRAEQPRQTLALQPPQTDQADTSEVMVFDESWIERTETPTETQTLPLPYRRILCLLTDPHKRRALTHWMALKCPRAELIFVAQKGAGKGRLANNDPFTAIDPADPHSWTNCCGAIAEQKGDIDAVLYLWALEDDALISSASVIAALLQGLNTAVQRPRRVLLAGAFKDGLQRCHLESWMGFERSMGLLWKEASLAVLMREAHKQDDDDEVLWPQRLWQALQSDKGSVLYQKGRSYQLGFTQMKTGPIDAQNQPSSPFELKT
jgi:polyketide synthase PksM